MKVLISILVLASIVLLLVRYRKSLKKGIELLSFYWFRLAFSFLILFLLNVSAGFLGVYIPVNVVSGLIVAVLGIPGIASICILALYF